MKKTQLAKPITGALTDANLSWIEKQAGTIPFPLAKFLIYLLILQVRQLRAKLAANGNTLSA